MDLTSGFRITASAICGMRSASVGVLLGRSAAGRDPAYAVSSNSHLPRHWEFRTSKDGRKVPLGAGHCGAPGISFKLPYGTAKPRKCAPGGPIAPRTPSAPGIKSLKVGISDPANQGPRVRVLPLGCLGCFSREFADFRDWVGLPNCSSHKPRGMADS